MANTFLSLQPFYSDMLKRMTIRPSRQAAIDRAAVSLRNGKARYERVEALTGVPWKFIAVLHDREDGGDFRGCLHNGEHIIGKGTRTRLVPVGRGPFATWEESAVDALKMHDLHLVKDWSLERICYEGERFNGFGYRNRGLPTPYLWSGSNQYAQGKFTEKLINGRPKSFFIPTMVDQQLGIIPIYLRLTDAGYTAQPPTPPVPPAVQQTATVLAKAKTGLRAASGGLGTLFALDNLTAVRDWLGAVAAYFPTKLIAGALIAGGLLWLATYLIQHAHTQEVAEPGALKTGDEHA